jgi:hypothetical protein
MTSYYILLIHDRVCCLSVRELTNCLNLNFIWQCTCKCKLDRKFNWAINNTKALENYVDICTYCLDIIVRGHAYRNVCISAKFGLIVQWFQRRRLQCEKLTIAYIPIGMSSHNYVKTVCTDVHIVLQGFCVINCSIEFPI